MYLNIRFNTSLSPSYKRVKIIARANILKNVINLSQYHLQKLSIYPKVPQGLKLRCRQGTQSQISHTMGETYDQTNPHMLWGINIPIT